MFWKRVKNAKVSAWSGSCSTKMAAPAVTPATTAFGSPFWKAMVYRATMGPTAMNEMPAK